MGRLLGGNAHPSEGRGTIRETTVLLLEVQGYRVDSADDGVQALERVASNRPNLIVLDHIMPRKSGLEVCEALRTDPETRSIPILLTTATHLSADQLGQADGFLMKPYQDRVLLSYISHLLEGDPPGRTETTVVRRRTSRDKTTSRLQP